MKISLLAVLVAVIVFFVSLTFTAKQRWTFLSLGLVTLLVLYKLGAASFHENNYGQPTTIHTDETRREVHRSTASDTAAARVVSMGPDGMRVEGRNNVVVTNHGQINNIAVARTSAPVPTPPKPAKIDFELRIPDDFAQWQEGSALVPPEERAEPHWAHHARESKPWIGEENGVRIVARQPAPYGCLTGYSGFEADQETAETAARRSAAAQLKALVLWRVKDEVQARPSLSFEDVMPWCNAEVSKYLAQKRPKDWWSQRVTRPYGDLHRAALHINVSPQVIDKLATALRVDIQRGTVGKFNQRREIVTLVVACLGLALVVLFLYLFLNAGTKGYFAWPLRVLSLGALSLLYVGLFYLKGWFPQ